MVNPILDFVSDGELRREDLYRCHCRVVAESSFQIRGWSMSQCTDKFKVSFKPTGIGIQWGSEIRHLDTRFYWILDSMGVLYSNAKVTWLGKSFEYRAFWTMNRLLTPTIFFCRFVPKDCYKFDKDLFGSLRVLGQVDRKFIAAIVGRSHNQNLLMLFDQVNFIYFLCLTTTGFATT